MKQQVIDDAEFVRCFGRNQPKSLSGIETMDEALQTLETLLPRRNQPKSLSGIETADPKLIAFNAASRNQPKSLSGIETFDNWRQLLTKRPESI